MEDLKELKIPNFRLLGTNSRINDLENGSSEDKPRDPPMNIKDLPFVDVGPENLTSLHPERQEREVDQVYDFLLIPEPVCIGGLLEYYSDGTADILLYRLIIDDSEISNDPETNSFIDKYQLEKSPLFLNKEKLAKQFTSANPIYSISDNLEFEEADRLLMRYFSWFYHQHVADHGADESAQQKSCTLNRKQAQELHKFLKRRI